MVDTKELAEKAKSKFGKFVPTPQTPVMAFLGKIFSKNPPIKPYINGIITASTLMYWWFQREHTRWAMAPLIVWVAFSFLLTVLGLIYWSAEKKRLDKDVKRIESDIQQIGAEINERKQYFEKIREELSKNNNN